nr:hypothetical protein [Burkholderia lata]
MLDLLTAVIAHEGGFIVVDVDVLIALRVNVDFLLPGLIFKAQLVEAFALVRLALDRHPRLVSRQFVRR